ncbi:hypothetical protein DL89DRAFT_327209 [Linderina pennispora]|uniref:Chitin-binding type-4 domain-containing protein n=1 Tax=Linderina pennispora TaxID=61395 RepID=A0A1Y1VRN5_9FUNG|nr:uncharacterized protein DL89DRAFT_327209 [Linderina pennispora]ORX63927.1 hypothetical protein DL89DRAFT_327209 [Linderina pennispora]
MFAKTVTSFMILAAAASAHMQINYPCPRFSPHCATTPELPPGESLNYNLASPIGSGGDILAPLCHSQTAWPQVNEKWTAGQSITVKFAQGGAAHGGGHCEFSLSYDGGKTFVVVHQELKYCFVGSASSSNTANTLSYTFNLPSDLPSTDHAVFAWSWVNAVGNREFYMDCADVSISGSSKSFTGKEMTIANYGSNYPTIGEFNGNYDTGLDVYSKAKQITVTGNGSSSSSSSSSGSSSSAAPASTSAAPITTVNEKWTAGQSITVKFAQGGAAHGGGHCEFSLSYDGGKTFVVIHQELKYCFVGSASSSNTANTLSYTFNLPSDLPSTDHAVFAWSWVNAVGNREFYMDCADVSISGSSKSFTGKEMTIANYGSNYPTHWRAKQITVTGNGSSSGSSGASSLASIVYCFDCFDCFDCFYPD